MDQLNEAKRLIQNCMTGLETDPAAVVERARRETEGKSDAEVLGHTLLALEQERSRAVANARLCAEVLQLAAQLKTAADNAVSALEHASSGVLTEKRNQLEAAAEPAPLTSAGPPGHGASVPCNLLRVPLKDDAVFLAACIQTLKEWTGTARADIVHDTALDDFATGILGDVRDKPNIAIIGFTTDGDVFGGFYSVPVNAELVWNYDPNIFAFSFESRGRCKTPQRFPCREKQYVYFRPNWLHGAVMFGTSLAQGFWLGDLHNNSYCLHVSECFKGLSDTALTGKSTTDRYYPPYHHCARLVAVQLS